MDFLLVAVIIFFGIVTQSMIGFGVALVTMPFLVSVLDPIPAATLLALVALPLQLVILARYHASLHVRPLWRIFVGSLIGIPVGIFLLSNLNQAVILTGLGLFLIGYALYSLLNLRLPPLQRPGWGFGFGFASGILGGAYNTAGPPLVIYGTALGWTSQQFKANMQVLFLIGNLLVIVIHVLAGHVTRNVVENLIVALPVVLIGSSVGFWFSQRINEARFRKLVLIALLLLGIRLLLP